MIAPAAAVPSPARFASTWRLQSRDHIGSELNVIGSTSDEALTRVERFLDEVTVAELRSVRIIHGYGTGQLRHRSRSSCAQPSVRLEFRPRAGPPGRRRRHVVELKE